MIPPRETRPSDVPDFTEAAPVMFRSRRKADDLPPLAGPAADPWSNTFDHPPGPPIVAAIVVVSLIGLLGGLSFWGVSLLLERL